MRAYARAFVVTGLLALLAAAALHLVVAVRGLGLWAPLVHLMLFGWITGLIVAVNYHTLPVFSGRDFPTTRLMWLHWATFSSGITLATFGIGAGSAALEIGGLALELTGALLFVVSIGLLLSRGRRHERRPPVPPIAGQRQVDAMGTRATGLAGLALPSALALLLGVRLGGIGNAWVLAAEHLAALGWTMLMIVGVAYHVLPRFSGRGTRGPAWARAQVGCHVVALALIVLGLGLGLPKAFALGGLLMALALALFAWTVWPTLRAVGARQAAPIHLTPKEHTP